MHVGRLVSCGRGSRQTLPILGGGGSQSGGPHGMGPNIHPGAQAGCLVLLAGECFSQRGTWKSALGFSTPEILFWICPYKGCREGLTATAPEASKFILGAWGQGAFRLMAAMAKNNTYGRCISPNFNEASRLMVRARVGVLEAF
jgi:hypothetical protein